MKLPNTLAVGMLLLIAAACGRGTDRIDMEAPRIDFDSEDAFPRQCAVLPRGESFTFRARFTDNVALGTFSLDIHHNFDHHNHSTEVMPCAFEPKKQAVNPLLFIHSYEIAGNPREYLAEVQLHIPEDIDPGDYHFTVQVTDKEGWSTRKGLSIKITE